MATGAELTYTSATALQMANQIFGDGALVTGASYSGAANSAALYSNGQLSPDVVPSTSGLILSTGNARDFTQSSGDPNRNAGNSTDTTGANNDAQFNALASANTFDASILTVSFIPTGSVMTINFVFSSDEYPEYAASQFNDVVGVWINGTNVPISVGNGQTGVTNISATTQPNLIKSNTGDTYNTEMDGFTVTLKLTIPVKSGVVNTIRIGVADVSDAAYDSNLLIAADSVSTSLIANADSVTMTTREAETLNVLGNDVKPVGATLLITHINGVPVVAGSTVVLPSGQSVTLNANGTFTILGNGDTEKVSFTYTVKDNLGHTDTGIVTINSVPCFVAGTLIRTPKGEVPVEDLLPGDLVMTHDHGPQPVRWSGRRRVAATGALAPIRIRAGTFGAHRTLLVSPQHRVLIRDSLAELLFGETEVLVAAKDLVNDRSVTVTEGGTVDYVHILFDSHQVVYSDGLATESYLPGPQTAHGFEREILAEICAIFPELDPETGQGYSPAVRRTLRGYEARVLFSAARAA